MQPYDYIEMKIPSKAQYIGVARLAISGVANRLGFTFEDIEDIKIALSEAVTNAVQHAYDEAGVVIVGCALFKDKMEIVVSDFGQSFDYAEVKSQTGPFRGEEDVSELREGGLGLYLMESLMDEVTINENEGVTVFMTKYLEGERGEEDVKTVSS